MDLQRLISENAFWAWITLTAGALVAAGGFKFVIRVLASKLKKMARKTESIWDDVAVDLLEDFRAWILFIWLFFVLTKPLAMPEAARKAVQIVIVIASVWQVLIWGLHVIRSWRKVVLDRKIQEDPSSAAALGLFYKAIQVAFIAVIVLVGLSNLGIDISALVAGLGVGGIAVALAAQNVLGDLLASLSIVLDKPFVVGDFIVTGNEKGTVEQIGIKTTRLRSLSGEELVLSNKDILESRVQNFKRMWQRRVVRSFGVIYATPPDHLERIPLWVKEIIERRPKLQFDRCHLSSYGASSLDYEFVFFVSDPDYNVYMDLQQSVLLEIMRKFAEENIQFAFPTQTLFIEKVAPQGS